MKYRAQLWKGAHDELLQTVRDSSAMTEDIWLRMTDIPIVKGPISRLLDLGVTQKGIYDVMKWVAVTGYVAAKRHGVPLP